MRLINVEKMQHFEVTLQGGDKKYVLLPFEHLYDIPEVKAIPLAKVKQTREEIKECSYSLRYFNEDAYDEDDRVVELDNVLKILNRLIAESEYK